MYSKETVLAKIADGSLAAETGRFRNIKNIDIDINPELEDGVPRPNPDEKQMAQARDIMQTNEEIYQNVSADMDQLEKQLGDVLELEGDTREVTQEEELAGVTYGGEEQTEEEQDKTDEEESEYGYGDYDGGE
jgi:flagellar protein FlaI